MSYDEKLAGLPNVSERDPYTCMTTHEGKITVIYFKKFVKNLRTQFHPYGDKHSLCRKSLVITCFNKSLKRLVHRT